MSKAKAISKYGGDAKVEHLPGIKAIVELMINFLNRRNGLTIMLMCCCYIQADCRMLVKKIHSISICAIPRQSVTLVSSYPRGSYQWNTGDTSLSISVRQGGIYTCITRRKRKRLAEVFEVEEKQVPLPNVTSDEVICKVEELLSFIRADLLWYRYADDTASSEIPTPPTDAWKTREEFSLYVARKEGGCISEKKEVRFEFLFYMLCPDFINRKRK